jgi:hypothetical protein
MDIIGAALDGGFWSVIAPAKLEPNLQGQRPAQKN